MTFWTVVTVVIHLLFVARILIRSHRQPASRVAWIIVIIVLPLLGILAYIFFGEVNIGRKRVLKMRKIIEEMPDPIIADRKYTAVPKIPKKYTSIFATGKSINGFSPVGGNRAELPADSNSVIDTMVADIDAAKEYVHLSFYIWLPDHNGLKVAQALKRAAGRGITCRAMADDIGSRILIRSEHWKAMKDAGVKLVRLLPVGNPLFHPFVGRIDLRNHQKIVVIDSKITYTGSQNCADPEFRIKPKYAPWVDVMMRFEGPIATQNLYFFVANWMLHTKENLYTLLKQPIAPLNQGFAAQAIASGPIIRPTAIPELFETLLYTARHKVIITSPYFIPNESLQSALCSAAYRGVETIIIFPQNNDSWVVGAASRSYYADLLQAGVKIYEYMGGLLHTKSFTLDNEVTLIGSANMDRRSFELNFENNILFYDPEMTTVMMRRQETYIQSSQPVTLEEVSAWSLGRRLWNNTIAILGPLL